MAKINVIDIQEKQAISKSTNRPYSFLQLVTDDSQIFRVMKENRKLVEQYGVGFYEATLAPSRFNPKFNDIITLTPFEGRAAQINAKQTPPSPAATTLPNGAPPSSAGSLQGPPGVPQTTIPPGAVSSTSPALDPLTVYREQCFITQACIKAAADVAAKATAIPQEKLIDFTADLTARLIFTATNPTLPQPKAVTPTSGGEVLEDAPF